MNFERPINIGNRKFTLPEVAVMGVLAFGLVAMGFWILYSNCEVVGNGMMADGLETYKAVICTNMRSGGLVLELGRLINGTGELVGLAITH